MSAAVEACKHASIGWPNALVMCVLIVCIAVVVWKSLD